MPFQIGDRVRCIDAGPKRLLRNGEEYIIEAIQRHGGDDYVNLVGHPMSYYARRFELADVVNRIVNEENGAIMLSPNVVKNTQLFKNVAPYIHSISAEELLFNLCKCVNTRWDSEFANLNDNIQWANTLQGTDFWLPLHQEYARNKGGW